MTLDGTSTKRDSVRDEPADTVGALAGQVLTVPEVAGILRISDDSVRRLIAAGTLAAIPGMARNLRISRAALEALLSGGAT